MTASAIYEGSVSHWRSETVVHGFRQRLFMMYIDLDELPTVFDRSLLWSARRPAPAWFRRRDYLGDPGLPLADAVRDLVRERTGSAPSGPIRLLTHLRYFGVSFNPVSFYYCFDAAGEHVEAVVAEVTNTPWGQRHAYVMRPRQDHAPGAMLRERFTKQLHVSPFFGMDHTYEWLLTEPGEQLLVRIENEHDGRVAFAATLSLRRRELTRAGLRRVLRRHPLMTLQVIAGIYGHALRLRLKGARLHRNPSAAAAR